MRKVLATLTALFFAATAAWAVNIPLYTGPFEAGNLVPIINNLITQINGGSSGIIAAYVSPTASSATSTQQILASITIPTGTLVTSGQSLRIRCGGAKAANGDAVTVGLKVASNQISSASFTTSSAAWDLEWLVTLSTPVTASVYLGRGFEGTTVIAPVSGYDTTAADTWATGQTASCLAATAGTANDVTLEDFIVEQVK